MAAKKFLLGLDLATSLAERLLAVVGALAGARDAGRDDLTPAELQRFRDADDVARDRLDDKIAAAKRRRIE